MSTICLPDFPESSPCRVVPLPLTIDEAIKEAAQHSVQKLLDQFVRENAVHAAACTWDRHFFVIAWQGELSGCRKSKVTSVLAFLEEQHAIPFLNPKPLWWQDQHGQTHCGGQSGLKQFITEHGVPVQAYNTIAEELGTWCEQNPAPVTDIPWLSVTCARIAKRLNLP